VTTLLSNITSTNWPRSAYRHRHRSRCSTRSRHTRSRLTRPSSCLRLNGKHYLGVGSDHTDRELETVDIGRSKRVCPKPICHEVIEISDWTEFDWDACGIRSRVDGRPYQNGSLASLRPPDDLFALLADQDRANVVGNLICFGGTVPLRDNAFSYGTEWDIELELPDGRCLTHSYRATVENP